MPDDSYNVALVLSAENRVSATVGTVTRDLGRIDNSLDQINRTQSGLARGFSNLQTVMQGAFAGITIGAAINFATEMSELGRQANAADQVFTQLGGTLEELRRATSFVVDDMTLMEGANRLLITGMAQTSQEASQFLEIAVKLGGALGQDAASSIENFNAAILNMSYERLDTLGISAANVRARVKELTDAGEDVQDAFRMAVLEEAGNTFERLGDSIDVGVTNLARFQAAWNNLMQDIGQGINNTLNAAAGTVMGAVDVAGAVVNRGVDSARVYEMASQMFEIPYDTAAGGLIGGVNPFTQDMLDAARAVIEQHDQAMADAARIIADGVAESDANNAARIQAELSAQAQGSYMSYANSAFATYNQYNAIGTNAGGIQEWQFSREYVSRAEAEQLRDVANETAETFTYLQGLFDQGLINESAIQSAESLRDMIDATADNAERAADAFEDMTLSQALGEGSGSPLGVDLAGSFLDAVQGLELGGTEYQQLADVIMLASGEITDASITYRDEVIPLLLQVYQSLGAGAAADAIANVEAYLQDAALQGRSAAQTAAGLALGTGYTTFGGSGFGGTQFTVNQGDNPTTVGLRYGMSPDQVIAAAGARNAYSLLPGTYGTAGGGGNVVPLDIFDNPAGLPGMVMSGGLAENAEAAREPFDALKTAADEIEDSFKSVSDTLDQLNGKEITIKLNIDQGSVPAWLREAMETATVDNGGTPPGQSRRGRVQPDGR